MRQTFAHLEPDFLFEYEKGGGGKQMAMMMWMMQQEQKKAEEERLRQEEQRKIDAKKLEDKTKAENDKKIADSRAKTDTTYNNTVAEARQKLRDQGYNEGAINQLMSSFETTLKTKRGGMPEIVEDPSTTLNTSYLDDITSTANTTFREGAGREFDRIFATDYEKNLVGDTMDDILIGKAIDAQYGEAKSGLDAALARGQINDQGYAAGLLELAEQKKSGTGRADQLGMSVLDKYRAQLTDYGKKQRAEIDKKRFGDVFDYAGIEKGLGELDLSFDSKLDQDIATALGGQSFFDSDLLLGKAGKKSGAMNNPGGGPANTAPSGNIPAGVGSPLEDRTIPTDEDEDLLKIGRF